MIRHQRVLEPPNLFDITLEISIDGITYDLHNDFTCKEANLLKGAFQLLFQSKTETITISFNEPELQIFHLNLESGFEYILDNFHRGKIDKNGKLYEDIEGKYYYYLEFYEEGKIELLCREVSVTIELLGI